MQNREKLFIMWRKIIIFWEKQREKDQNFGEKNNTNKIKRNNNEHDDNPEEKILQEILRKNLFVLQKPVE